MNLTSALDQYFGALGAMGLAVNAGLSVLLIVAAALGSAALSSVSNSYSGASARTPMRRGPARQRACASLFAFCMRCSG
jgi:hypothetical protein